MKKVYINDLSIISGGIRDGRCDAIEARNGPYPSDQWLSIPAGCITGVAAVGKAIITRKVPAFWNGAKAAIGLYQCGKVESIDCSKEKTEREISKPDTGRRPGGGEIYRVTSILKPNNQFCNISTNIAK